MNPRSWKRGVWSAALIVTTHALALQPLDTFIKSAQDANPDDMESRANAETSRASAEVSLGRVLPSLNVKGTYTRNQYQVALGPLPALGLNERSFIYRFNQLDGYFTANVTLVDVAGFVRVAAARTAADSAASQLKATQLQVEAAVTQDYYQLVANQALVTASQHALEVSQKNLQLTNTRFETGKAATLDVDRAKADLERQSQALTNAKLQVELAQRALESATGVTPDLSQEVQLQDDLHDEAPLIRWQRGDRDLPQVLQATQTRVSSEQTAQAAKLAFIPSLNGNFTEHLTNAASFVGQPWSYIATINIVWNLDYTLFAQARLTDAQLQGSRARERRAQLNAHDAIHRAWTTVSSSIARSRSARAEQEASTHASRLAQDRYEAGAATQLDLLQAQRDAFSADVSRIQADADLANSRLQLRIAAAIDPFDASSSAAQQGIVQ